MVGSVGKTPPWHCWNMFDHRATAALSFNPTFESLSNRENGQPEEDAGFHPISDEEPSLSVLWG